MMMMSHLNDSRAAMSLIPIISGDRFIFDTYHKGNAWVTPLGQRLGEYSSTMEHMDWGVHHFYRQQQFQVWQLCWILLRAKNCLVPKNCGAPLSLRVATEENDQRRRVSNLPKTQLGSTKK